MSFLSAALLAQTIDDHIEWMSVWTRSAFYERQGHTVSAESLPAPESFAKWRSEAVKTVQDQPALNKLVGQYDQLHRLAKLAILKTPEGIPVEVNDYDSVVLKYQELITGLRRLERALAAAESGLDSLTGLRSRQGMRDDLMREICRFLRTGKPFCLALMDIDYFKNVNDTYGHDNGDKVLSSVSNYISRSIRPFDEAWRWGGEEILLCLKEVDMRTGKSVLERVRAGLEKLPIKLINGNEINVTASFGIVVVDNEATVDNLLAKADKALYSAKTYGRNRIEPK
jgi:diguanylate cyclase